MVMDPTLPRISVRDLMMQAFLTGWELSDKTVSQDEYLHIVKTLMDARGLNVPWEDAQREALAWTVSHSGRSPRLARQFVDSLTGRRS